MSGNASRYAHQKDRRYSQLVLSQGAMVTDSDQRESMAIGLRNTTTLGATSIRSGVPQTRGMVHWVEDPTPSAHKIMAGLGPGRVVADGHVGEVRLIDGQVLEAGGVGIDLVWKQQDLLGLDAIADLGGPLAVYADLWHRFVGPPEDPRQVDPAFLSAETATRTELVAQLKVSGFLDAAPEDADLVQQIQDNGLPLTGDFRLATVTLTAEVVEPDACDPCATTLEDPNQDAGNELFRLEIHSSGYNRPGLGGAVPVPTVPCREPDSAFVMLKWSRDNGSVEVPVSQADAILSDSGFDTTVFELTSVPAEQRLGLYTDGMTDRLATLHSRADIEAAVAAAAPGTILRVWDGAVTVDLDTADLAVQPVGTLSAEGSVEKLADQWTLTLELGGLALTLEASLVEDAVPYVLPGDAWCVEIREYATGNGETLIWNPAPVEIEHHYAFIGVIENGAFRNEDQPDMRGRSFPALTEIDALDIHYDNSLSGAEAWTVQGALDLLFDLPPGEAECDCQCTFSVDPEKDLADQFEEFARQITDKQIGQALICIPAGHFELVRSVAFRSGVGLTIRGAGRDLTIIELVGELDSTDALAFFGIAGVALEDLSIVGDLKTAREERVSAIGVHDVADFSAWRVSIRAVRSGDGLCHAIAIQPESDGETDASVSVRECVFRIGAGGQGLGIWRGATKLRIEDSVFRSVDVETFGGSRLLNAATDFVANTRAVRRTPERERQIDDGFFAAYPGNSELLLDFTGVPADHRAAAVRFWSVSLRMLDGGGAIDGPGGFDTVRDSLTTINDAANRLVEAEAVNLSRSVGDGGRPAISDDFPVLNALTRGTSHSLAAGFGTLGANRAGSLTETRAILAAGGSTRDDGGDRDALTGSDREALRQVVAANDLLAGDNRVATFAGAIAPVLELAGRGNDTPGLPTWGVFAFTRLPMATAIEGNSFLDVDVAIDLAARAAEALQDTFTPPIPATIRDNTVRRTMRTNRVFAPDWGDGGEGISEGRQPINLNSYSDVTIENNALSQIRPAGMTDADYGRMYGPNFPEQMSSYAAIVLRGQMGPKLRGVANSAFSFRHCIHVNCAPVKARLDPGDPAANFWLFRENSALPLRRGEIIPWAVQIGEIAEEAGIGSDVRLVMSDNWLPNPNFEQ